MKRTAFLILLISLAGNAALLVALAVAPSGTGLELRPVVASRGGKTMLGTGDGTSGSGKPARRASPTEDAKSPSGSPSPRSPASAAAASAARAQLWSVLQSDDLPTLMARLRAAGFPPMVIRAIVTAQIDARIARRSDELFGPVETKPFWKGDPFSMFGFYSDPKKSETFFQLYRDRSRQLREALGDDVDLYYADPTAEQRRRFGNLSAAKIDRVQRIVDDYDEMMSQQRAANGGVTLPEDREKQRLLEQEKKADLAAALTPAELDQYEMRNNLIKDRLAGAMTLMNATEAEFSAIFRIQKAYEERFRDMRPSEAMVARGYASDDIPPAQVQLQQDIKTALGEQRYAEYFRATTLDFQLLTRLTQRENSPPGTAERVFAMRDTVAQESNRIYQDTALSVDQKRAALQTLAAQTRAQILSALGPTAGPSFAQSARWLTLVERGSSVTFGPENRISSKKVEAPVPAAAPKN